MSSTRSKWKLKSDRVIAYPPTDMDWERFVDNIRSNDTRSVREWFRQRQTPDTSCWADLFPQKLSDPVFVAATIGNVAIFDLLIHHRFKPDRTTHTKRRTAQPVHMAARRGHLKILRRLINDCDIPVDTEDNSYRTPLHYAVSAGDPCSTAVVKYLVSKGADVNYCPAYSYTSSPFVTAVKNGHQNLAQMMLKHNANINCRFMPSGCLFNWFVSCGNIQMVQWLHSNGARADLRGEPEGCTAFQYALKAPSYSRKDMLKFLIKINVPLNEVTSEGHSALYCMLCDKYTSVLPVVCLRLVVDAGYRVTIMDYEKACQVWHDGTGLTQLQECLSHPRTLQQLCCFSLRDHLGNSLFGYLDDVSIPSPVKDYIRLAHLVNS